MKLTSAETMDPRGLTSINSREVVIRNGIDIPVSDLVKEHAFKAITQLMKVINKQSRDISYTFFVDTIKLQIVSDEAHSTISETSTREN